KYDDLRLKRARNLALEAERPASEITDRALARLAVADPRPWFLWVHYFDPHSPYAAPGGPPPSAGRRAAYEAEIAFMDRPVVRPPPPPPAAPPRLRPHLDRRQRRPRRGSRPAAGADPRVPLRGGDAARPALRAQPRRRAARPARDAGVDRGRRSDAARGGGPRVPGSGARPRPRRRVRSGAARREARRRAGRGAAPGRGG